MFDFDSLYTEQKAIYGLVGYPLGHSLSPLMHNAAFEALEVDATYKLFALEQAEVASFFEKLHAPTSPIFGLNVTVPYKEIVVPLLDSVSPFVEKVGAVNTVVITPDRKLVGQNTDGPGFLAHLAEVGCDIAGKRIAILGAGGAARAVVSVLSLVEEKPESIRIYDVDREKANALVDDLGSRMDMRIVSTVQSIDDLEIADSDVLINATPIGMKKTDPCLVEPEVFHTGQFVYDLVYNPAETVLLRIAREQGARTSNGLGMLYFQGVLAFEHWAATRIDEGVKLLMREALEEGLARK